ncbi:MAG: hypothetical protein P8Y42_22285 [Exilibacterium sp.]
MVYERQKAHRKAFEWIVGLVREKDIPFLICGGLAAIGYGAERDLHDIDLFVPGEAFEKIVEAGKDFISKPAGHYREAGWDLDYVQFIYGGVKVEVGSAEGVLIQNAHTRTWVNLEIDFSRRDLVTVFGIPVPLMVREDLIGYKSLLSRPVDRADIEAIRGSGPGFVI